MSPPSPRRAEIVIADDHKLSHRCRKLSLNVLEIAAVASGGFALVQSARRIMTGIATLEAGVPQAKGVNAGAEDHAPESHRKFIEVRSISDPRGGS